MNVKLYQNNSDNRACRKNLSGETTISCQILDSVSIQSPTLLIRKNQLPNNINYCYISDFNRYYYISNISIYDGECFALSLKCDVLMSFYPSFASSPCIAKRSTSNYNPLIEDAQVVKLPSSTLVFRRLGTGFTPSSSSGSYILTVGGK